MERDTDSAPRRHQIRRGKEERDPIFREIHVRQVQKRVLSLEGKLEHTGAKHRQVFPNPHNPMVVKPEPEERTLRSELSERRRFQEEVSLEAGGKSEVES